MAKIGSICGICGFYLFIVSINKDDIYNQINKKVSIITDKEVLFLLR